MSKLAPSTKDFAGNYPTISPIENPVQNWGDTQFVVGSRRVIAGLGLEGGGNLTQDIELSVSFGSEEGTAVEGNDPRLEDSREWKAPLVTLEAAREGVETDPTQWSASLVHSAIDGWWVTSNFGEKLDSIEHGATKNFADDYLLDRQFHTGTQPMDTIDGLEDALSISGSGRGLFSPVKIIDLGDEIEYELTERDIGKTLVFSSNSGNLKVKMLSCFGKLGDEVHIVAPPNYNVNDVYESIFYSDIEGNRYEPQYAGACYPWFRDSRSIVCLKKISKQSAGMPNWLLFGDLFVLGASTGPQYD